MDWLFNGLPLHVLLTHFVVTIVPLTAFCLVLAAAWPAARRRLGIVTPILALSALSEVHTHLGKDLPGKGRLAHTVTSRPARVAITVLLILAVVTVVVGSVVAVVIIGESGARAAWESRVGKW